ncbi:hypothetical protein ACLKA6_011648 [Drosophila palustris]
MQAPLAVLVELQFSQQLQLQQLQHVARLLLPCSFVASQNSPQLPQLPQLPLLHQPAAVINQVAASQSRPQQQQQQQQRNYKNNLAFGSCTSAKGNA